MATEFLFRFGFESPEDRAYNRRSCDPVESSSVVFIAADSEADALAWGHAIAESFLKHLYSDPSISWSDIGYASWIEHDKEAIREAIKYGSPQRVEVGQHPDYDRI